MVAQWRRKTLDESCHTLHDIPCDVHKHTTAGWWFIQQRGMGVRVQQVQRGEKKARVEGEERRTEMEACTHRIARTWCSRSLPPPQRAHALPTRGGTAGRERHGRWRWEGVCSVCVVCLPPSCSLRVCECGHTWSAMLSGGGVPLSTLSRALPGVHLVLCTASAVHTRGHSRVSV